MDEQNVAEIIDGVLADFDLHAGPLLAALVGVMVERHLDVELRRLGRREPYPIHNERADALKAVNDALHQAHARLGAKGEGEEVLRAVMAVLMHCQFAAEKEAGIGGDDEDEGPAMQLVRD